MGDTPRPHAQPRDVSIPPHGLKGILTIPRAAVGLVIFAHGSGSSRLSPRNAHVARSLNEAALATLLFDLLLPAEAEDRRNVFDIPLLASRLGEAMQWCRTYAQTMSLPIGLFGASTGAAAALVAAADWPDLIAAVVSRGGRPDLASRHLPRVRAPTLLVVGELDDVVIDLNESAKAQMTCHTWIEIVPGATHLFEEPGTLDRVIELARAWFLRHLSKDAER